MLHQSLWPHTLLVTKIQWCQLWHRKHQRPLAETVLYCMDHHLSTSEFVSSCPSQCTWRSVPVWCPSVNHSNLLRALFPNTTLHTHRLFDSQLPTKGWPCVSIDLRWIMFVQLCMISIQLCSVHYICSIQSPRFTMNVLLWARRILVAIETEVLNFLN